MDQTPKMSPDPLVAWQVTLLDGPDAETYWILKDGEMRTLGRSSRCGIKIGLETVSRVCCTLRATAQEVILEDLEPVHVTLVNHAQIAARESCSLRDGDVFQVGGRDGWRLRIESGETERNGEAEEGVKKAHALPEENSQGMMSSDGSREMSGESASSSLNSEEPTRIEGLNASSSHATEPPSRAVPAAARGGNLSANRDDEGKAPDPTQCSHADDTGDPTIYLAEEDDVGHEEDEDPGTVLIEDKDKPAMSRSRLLIVGLLIVAFLVYVSHRDPSDPKPQIIEKGVMKVSVLPPGRGEVDVNGTIRITPGVGNVSGMIVKINEQEENRWVSFEKAVLMQQKELAAHKDSFARLQWLPRMDARGDGKSLQLFRGPKKVGAWYCAMEGHPVSQNTSAIAALARIWLCGESIIIAVAWGEEGDYVSTRELNALLDRVSIHPEPEHVFDRRSEPVDVLQSPADVESQVLVSRRLLKEKGIDPANTWRAYHHAVNAWKLTQAERISLSLLDRDRVWETVCESSKSLHNTFLELQFEVERALMLGKRHAAVLACEAIQMRIPDRTDYRWQWADAKRRSASEAENKGLF